MSKIKTSKPKQSSQTASAYSALFQDIKHRIREAQYQALRAVNKELVQLYWDIGQIIVKKQNVEGWGKSVVEKLASDLHKEFPGMMGFSVSNLWRMRNLFLNYEKSKNLAPLVREISWSHNLNILERCNDNLEREFYIRMTRRMGWSKNVLIHQIENKTYEKTMVNQTNFKKTLPEKIKTQAHLAVKDDYVLDFLNLKENHDEQQLEQALLIRMNRFLIEMGGAFAFMGNQYRLEVGGKDFFIDILLYHRRLNCLVALELKVGEFKPEYVGKMQFYLAALDDLMKQKNEKPSIGIILCKEKNRTVVEYALKESRKPMGVAQYRILTRIPKEMKDDLPGPEQICRLLEEV